MSTIPPIPRMTELDEEWIAYAAGLTKISPEQARGLLAAYLTMRERHIPKALAHVRGEIKRMEAFVPELVHYEKSNPVEVALDRALYSEVIPQLQELAR